MSALLTDRSVYYFLGIGGIGMSALARYFHSRGARVVGYDRTSTPLTTAMQLSGIAIHFDDALAEIPAIVHHTPKEKVLVVYTPAIPKEHREFNWLKDQGFTCVKRSELLGEVTRTSRCIAVAGTHGKTTTSALTAHLLTAGRKGCNAFLGGIATNYQSNLLLDAQSDLTVVEADEFDRSFLTLTPACSVITSMDADHLDIYGDASHVVESFRMFARKTREGGVLVVRKGLPLDETIFTERPDLRIQTYSIDGPADYFADHIHIVHGRYRFNLHTPFGDFGDVEVGLPGRHNVENAVAASALALLAGLSPDALGPGLASFRGVERRFQLHLANERFVYIDDYAHHPTEIQACIRSARELYPGKKLIGVFQPHLFTRTRDFADGFAESLDELDQIFLLPVYPARELPIPGVDSHMLLDKIRNPLKKVVEKDELLKELREVDSGVILTMGAGDIDTLTDAVREVLK